MRWPLTLPRSEEGSSKPQTLLRGGFCLFAFTLPLSTTVSDLAYVFTVLMVIYTLGLKTLAYRLRQEPLSRLFLGIFAGILLGCTYTVAPFADLPFYLTRYAWFLFTPILLVYPWTVEDRRLALQAFLAAMVLTLILSYVHRVFPFSLHKDVTLSLFKDRIVQSFFMSIAASVFFYKTLHAVSTQKRGLWALLATLSLLEIFICEDGRTGYVVSIFLFLYVAWIHLDHRKFFLFLMSLLCLIGLVYRLSPTMQGRGAEFRAEIAALYAPALTQLQTVPLMRSKFYKEGWMLIQKKPIFGYGTGSLPTILSADHRCKTAENTLLNLVLQFGLFGAAAYFLFYFILWRKTASLPAEWQFLARCVILGVIVGGQFTGWWLSSSPVHFFSWIVVLCYARV